MGETKDFARGKAEFLEPSPPESAIMGGEVEHRRPGPPGASPEEEARHEANLRPVPAPLAVCPEDLGRVDRGSHEPGAMAPPGIPVVPQEVRDPVPDDRPADGRAVEAAPPSPDASGDAEWRSMSAGRLSRRRSRRRPKVYEVEIVRLKNHARNDANAYTTLSTPERYECLMKRLANVWSAILRRRSVGAFPRAERRRAA
jgi:hypothetical protein